MKRLFYTAITFLLIGSLSGQVAPSDDLYTTISEKDSLLFNVGFNTCDIPQIKELIGTDFTFYHDQSGITKTKKAFVESIASQLCQLPYQAHRELNSASQSIFPLKKNGTLYGAIQNGTHRFYALKGDNQKYLTSVARFTHTWIIEDGQWKLRSGLSYDHQDNNKKSATNGLFTNNTVTEKWLKEKHVPALGIGYIENNQIVQTSVFGELTAGKPAPLNTIWNVASLTKPITALVALKLIDAGQWELDAPLSDYYIDPDLQQDSNVKKLTTRIVLSHQTGLPNWRGNASDGKLKFEFEPGTRYQYSGEGFEYLKNALETKLGKSLEQLAQELIFDPLKMQSTSFVWNAENKPFAQWHNAEGKRYKTGRFNQASAADDLLTTVEDYSKFMQHVLQGAGLSESLQQEMKADQVRVSTFKHFGLGWWVDEQINANGDFALVHGGDDIGVHCIAFILPHSQKGLLIFTNSDNGTDAFMEVVNHYLDQEAKGIFNAEMN